MKMLLSFLAISLLSLTAHAGRGEFRCFTKYFNRGSINASLSADFTSDKRLVDLNLKVEREEIRSADVLKGEDYNGRVYTNRIVFDLEADNVRKSSDWDFLSLLLPVGYSDLELEEKFEAIVITRASDGGAYNRMLCRITK